ncbi:MAG: hypothetical protein K9M57_06395 [Phycisphaerae bacterium]|nr:hypothetical protein [Phycisphaerae bacterium]
MSPQAKLTGALEAIPTVKSVSRWALPDFVSGVEGPAFKVSTDHYEIYTTLTDPLLLRQVPTFLESAFAQYTTVLDPGSSIPKKMPVYFFNTRVQWEAFTVGWAGAQAENYLKIQAGAYYSKGACVAYHISRQSNFSVLAHEAWHQYNNNVFRYHLPAWLDEGLATQFEAYRWKGGKVIFDARLNGGRLFALKKSIRSGQFFSISELLQLDAGKILSVSKQETSHHGKSNPRVVAYYAQIYALTRFLQEYNYSYYLAGFDKMLFDGFRGRWALSAADGQEAFQKERNPTRQWNSRVGPEIFNRYISADVKLLENSYRLYCKQLIANVHFSR